MHENGNHESVAPEVAMRIPGAWSGPAEFEERLPRGCRCTETGLLLTDGSEYELHVHAADDEFPRIFAGGCPKLPTESEREQIENYRVNVCVTGRGGNIEAAKGLMSAAAAVLTAGGAGVFVDNSGISHGATDWKKLLDGADDGGVYWAFVSAARSDDEIYSLGMHVLGFRDAIIPATGDAEHDARTLHTFLGYVAFSGATIRNGDALGDELLPTFRAFAVPDDRCPENAPMFNPLGRWRLVPYDVQQN